MRAHHYRSSAANSFLFKVKAFDVLDYHKSSTESVILLSAGKRILMPGNSISRDIEGQAHPLLETTIP